MYRLGGGPDILGTYVQETKLRTPEDLAVRIAPREFDLVRVLPQPGHNQKSLDGLMKRTPKVERWVDLLPTLDLPRDTSEAVQTIIQEAAENDLDLDFVVARSIHALSEGIVGLGQSEEARAYLFCHISSVYAYDGDILTFELPARAHRLLANLLGPDEPSIMQRVLAQQMRPIIESLVLLVPEEQEQRLPTREPHPGLISSFWLFVVSLSASVSR